MSRQRVLPEPGLELADRGDTPSGPDCGCGPCVAQLSSLSERLAALGAAIEAETEPLVTLTHLLHLCRDEHPTLWEQAGAPSARARLSGLLGKLGAKLPAAGTEQHLDTPVRAALAGVLHPRDAQSDRLEPVLIAHGLAQLLDQRYGHTFSASFHARSPYQPGVGDPIPLGSPDLRTVLDMRPTSPPWRLANRLDETRRIRLAGEWATQFRVVFDYSLFDTLTGVIGPDTIVATCHPNRSLAEFALPADPSQPTFGVQPADPSEQARQLDELIAVACGAGADIVVLPELCVTQALAVNLQRWVRRAGGVRLLVAGSFHHDDHAADYEGTPRPTGELRRRNTALAWVRGHDGPLMQDKHSPADRPVVEDIQPEGWPRLHIYVTADGWHVVIAICRDLLNPQAVHALSEAGANFILVPAMSETLVPFGGPAAQFVGSGQAIVAIANNPADWSTGQAMGTRPARALFGHPGLGQQTRFVHSADAGPGVAVLAVRSAHISWIDTPSVSAETESAGDRAAAGVADAPGWVTELRRCADQTAPLPPLLRPVTLRPAAVLVLLAETDAGPTVLLTERAPDLSHYAGQLVFPGGAADPSDDGPVATALRESAEEVGLDPRTVHVLGTLPALGLPESGFLVTPVLGWTEQLPAAGGENQSEVCAIRTVAIRELPHLVDAARDVDQPHATPAPQQQVPLGRMTRDVLTLILASLREASPSVGSKP